MGKFTNKNDMKYQREYIDKLMESIEDDNISVRQKVAYEIKEIYTKNKNDLSSYAYIFALIKISELQTGDDLFDTISEVKDVYDSHINISNAILFASILTSDAYDTKTVDIVYLVNELKDIYKEFKCDELSEYLLYVSRLVYEEDLSIEEFYEFYKYFEEILNQHPTKSNIYNFAISLITFTENVKPTTTDFYIKKLKELYTDNEDLLEIYCIALSFQAHNSNIEFARSAIEELEEIIIEHKNPKLVIHLCAGLANISATDNVTREEILIAINKVKNFEEILDSDFYVKLVTSCAISLSLDAEVEFGKYTLFELETLLKKYGKTNEDAVLNYAKANHNIYLKAPLNEKIDLFLKNYVHYLTYQNDKIIAIRNSSAYALAINETKEDIVKFIRTLFVKLENKRASSKEFLKLEYEANAEDLWIFSELEEVIYYLFNIFEMYIQEKNDLSFFEKGIYLYKNFENEEIAEAFSKFLSKTFYTFYKTENLTDELVSKYFAIFSEIHEKWKNDYIAQQYLDFLSYIVLVSKESELSELNSIALKIYNDFECENIANLYCKFLHFTSFTSNFNDFDKIYEIIKENYEKYPSVEFAFGYTQSIYQLTKVTKNDKYSKNAKEIFETWAKDTDKYKNFNDFVVAHFKIFITLYKIKEDSEKSEILNYIESLYSKYNEIEKLQSIYEIFKESV